MSDIPIPYTVAARPDTGLNNGKIGIWLFLASEVMLFGALFATYILLRVGAVEWPHGSHYLNVPLATLNTVVLISSSVTMVMAWYSLKIDQFNKFRMYMAATVGFGGVFLIVKYFEYSHKFHVGELPGKWFHAEELMQYPAANMYFTLYFLMTGLHAFHVIVGMSVLIWVAKGIVKGRYSPTYYVPVELGALYWHLVDLVWIFLFPLLYLI